MYLPMITATIVVVSFAVSIPPAGIKQPFGFRIVTMDGRTGSAFYSVIDRRYLFAGRDGYKPIRTAAVWAHE